jgi:hypothetical protein
MINKTYDERNVIYYIEVEPACPLRVKSIAQEIWLTSLLSFYTRLLLEEIWLTPPPLYTCIFIKITESQRIDVSMKRRHYLVIYYHQLLTFLAVIS